MRWYFSFGYNLKKLAVSISIADELKEDLVGYGYDTAPVLRRIEVCFLLFTIVIGNLIIID